MTETQEQPEPTEPTKEEIEDLLEQAKHAFQMSMDDLRILGNRLLAVLLWACKFDPSLRGEYNSLQGTIGTTTKLWTLASAVRRVAELVRPHMERLPEPEPSPAPEKPRPDTDTGLPNPMDD